MNPKRNVIPLETFVIQTVFCSSKSSALPIVAAPGRLNEIAEGLRGIRRTQAADTRRGTADGVTASD